MEYLISAILIIFSAYAYKKVTHKILTILYIVLVHVYYEYTSGDYIIYALYAAIAYLAICLYIYFFKDYHKFKKERLDSIHKNSVVKKIKTDKLYNDIHILQIAKERFKIKLIILQNTLNAYIDYKDNIINGANNIEFLKSSLDIVKFKNKIKRIKKDMKSLNLYIENIDYVLNQTYDLLGKKSDEVPAKFQYHSMANIDTGMNDLQIELMDTKDMLIKAINSNSALNEIIKKKTNVGKTINIFKFVNIDESSIDIQKYINEYENINS